MHRIGLDGAGQDWQAIAAAVKARRTFRGMRIRIGFGYLDGAASEWPAEAWTELGGLGVQLARITVTGATVAGAEIADCENGDLDPASAVTWAQHELNAGTKFPVIYVNRTEKPAVLAEAVRNGLTLGRNLGLWVATLDGSFLDLNGTDLRAQPGVVGVQYLPASRSGGPYDVSLITDETWLPEPPAAWTAGAVASLRSVISGAQAVLADLEAHPAG